MMADGRRLDRNNTSYMERTNHAKTWKNERDKFERDLQVLGVRRWRDLVADRKKMEGHCSTGQSPQWAVVLMEEEE